MSRDPFLKVGSVEVDAFVLGIGRMRWKSAKPDWSEEIAFKFMHEHEFDVLPIESKDQPISQYFLRTPLAESCLRKEITEEDILPAEIHAIELIGEFSIKSRKFFFLTINNKIEGLITISELNSHQMKLAIFALISELEIRLSRHLNNNVEVEEIEKLLEGSVIESYEDGELSEIDTIVIECLKSNGKSEEEIEMFFGKKEKPIDTYKRDRSEGIDRNIIEYVYFKDLLNLVKKKELFKPLGYKNKKEFEKLNPLNSLRNDVAHPVKSLVTEDKPVSKLWKRIEIMKDALLRLQQHQG